MAFVVVPLNRGIVYEIFRKWTICHVYEKVHDAPKTTVQRAKKNIRLDSANCLLSPTRHQQLEKYENKASSCVPCSKHFFLPVLSVCLFTHCNLQSLHCLLNNLKCSLGLDCRLRQKKTPVQLPSERRCRGRKVSQHGWRYGEMQRFDFEWAVTSFEFQSSQTGTNWARTFTGERCLMLTDPSPAISLATVWHKAADSAPCTVVRS